MKSIEEESSEEKSSEEKSFEEKSFEETLFRGNVLQKMWKKVSKTLKSINPGIYFLRRFIYNTS